MLQRFFGILRSQAGNDQKETRRKHPRREVDRCVIVIHGQAFPVEDWSFGGVQIVGNDRLFSEGQELDFTLKFKLRDAIIEVPHKGRVVRKASQKIAMQFEPLSKTARRYFQKVVDDHVAGEFATSQAG